MLKSLPYGIRLLGWGLLGMGGNHGLMRGWGGESGGVAQTHVLLAHIYHSNDKNFALKPYWRREIILRSLHMGEHRLLKLPGKETCRRARCAGKKLCI